MEQQGGGSEENSTDADPSCLSFFSSLHLHFFPFVSPSTSPLAIRFSQPDYFRRISQSKTRKTLAQTLLSKCQS